MPSRRALEDVSAALAECQTVLQTLFPTHSSQQLCVLSRDQLIALLYQDEHSPTFHGIQDGRSLSALGQSPSLSKPASWRARHATTPSSSVESAHSHRSSGPGPTPAATPSDDGALTALEQVPTPDVEWDEERRERAQEHLPAEADDVNALSFTMDRRVSYLGISSVRAALLVMLKLRPSLRLALATEPAPPPPSSSDHQTRQQQQASVDNAAHGGVTGGRRSRVTWSRRGQALVDAYFSRFHGYLPMLDEPTFRAEFAGADRRENDLAWQALANMVLALGSVSAGRSDDRDAEHAVYYDRAVSLLPLTVLGSSRIETVQALALMGGEYLHYVNRPNMAYGVLGAAVRMGSVMGLHKLSLTPSTLASASSMSPTMQRALDTRRRTWWTLFCLDTWATMLTGRPSFGRCALAANLTAPWQQVGHSPPNDSSISSKGDADSSNDVEVEAGPGSDLQLLNTLAESVKFAKIATQLQDAFAASPVLSCALRADIDAQMAAWRKSQPWPADDEAVGIGSDVSPGSDSTQRVVIIGDQEPWQLAQCIMKWRYNELRMLLHRPVLLLLANSGCGDWAECSADDIASVEACLEFAVATVNDIAREWTPNQVSGWKAAWYLHQASMVPLLILLWNPRNAPVDTLLEPCRRTITTTLTLLQSMIPWSLTAARTCALIDRLFRAISHSDDFHHQPVATTSMDAAYDSYDTKQSQLSHNEGLEATVPPNVDLVMQDFESDLGLDFFLFGHDDAAMAAVLGIGSESMEGSFLT